MVFRFCLLIFWCSFFSGGEWPWIPIASNIFYISRYSSIFKCCKWPMMPHSYESFLKFHRLFAPLLLKMWCCDTIVSEGSWDWYCTSIYYNLLDINLEADQIIDFILAITFSGFDKVRIPEFLSIPHKMINRNRKLGFALEYLLFSLNQWVDKLR